MKSSARVLGVIPAARAERMLEEWVNTELLPHSPHVRITPADVPAWERLFRRYPEIPAVADVVPFKEQNANRFLKQMEMASATAGYLRRAWNTADLRSFEWYTWKAQSWYEWHVALAKHDVTPMNELDKKMERDSRERMIALLSKATLPLPTVDVDKEWAKALAARIEADQPPTIVTPVEAAIFHLRQNRRRALHCLNPECPSPYFFRTRKGQEYCSPECAKPAQREAKRKWWDKNRAKKEE